MFLNDREIALLIDVVDEKIDSLEEILMNEEDDYLYSLNEEYHILSWRLEEAQYFYTGI